MISKEVINEVAKFMVRGYKIRCKDGILLVIKVNLKDLLKIFFQDFFIGHFGRQTEYIYCIVYM